MKTQIVIRKKDAPLAPAPLAPAPLAPAPLAPAPLAPEVPKIEVKISAKAAVMKVAKPIPKIISAKILPQPAPPTVGYKFSKPTSVPVGTVLSFDVGIKNLAYCMLSLQSQRDYTIHDWGIIDLITEEEDYICTGYLKGGKKKGAQCTHKASFFEPGDKKKCYCSTHKPQGQLVPIKMVLTCEAKMKSGQKTGESCGKNASYYKELSTCERVGYCSAHSKGVTGLTRYYTVDNISDTELRIKLYNAMDQKPEFGLVSTVLVEHQPLHAREKMKSIATSLYDYFVLRYIIDGGKKIEIRSIDAKNKLTVYDGPPLSCPLKEQYDRNKWYGRKYCEWAIRNKPDYLGFFQDFSKQDDLADSMLQGMWFLLFGIHGKTGDISSNHQKLVYLEQNTAKLKKIKAVRPSDKQTKKGRYSLSNIRYLANRYKVEDYHKVNGLLESINFYFSSLDQFKEALSDKNVVKEEFKDLS